MPAASACRPALPLLLAVLLGAPPTARASDESDHVEHAHHVIRITDGKLSPGTLHIGTDDAVAWANYSTTKTAVISFDRDVARRIVCRAPGAFQLTQERLESSALRPHQFASLCQLQPGEYRYAVELRGITTPRGAADPLEGRIIVE